MLLFRMIPVTLRAFTIAIGSVLVMTLAKHHARKRVAVAPARIDDDRHDLLDIPARSGHDHTPTVVR